MVWKERLCSLQAPVACSALNRQFGIIRTTTRETTTKHKLKMAASKLRFRFVVQTRLLFFLVAAASISLALQLQIGYAQNASEQPTLDAKMHTVQNSITDATTSPIQDKGGKVDLKTFGAV